jgi:hypothetical protein
MHGFLGNAPVAEDNGRDRKAQSGTARAKNTLTCPRFRRGFVLKQSLTHPPFWIYSSRSGVACRFIGADKRSVLKRGLGQRAFPLVFIKFIFLAMSFNMYNIAI